MNVYAQKVFDSISGVGAWALVFYRSLKESFQHPPSWGLLLDQFYNIGVLSVPVVAITGLSTGMVLAAQAFYQLADKGLEGAAGLFVGKAMLTEVGPVLAAFMITGRVGSSMTAVLGTMKVTEQIDALRSMAVSPLRYLVAPRIIGSMVMVPLLTIFSALMGIYGGYLISVFVFGMSPQAYFDPMPSSIPMFDVWIGMAKAFVFGVLISTISCYKGLNARGGAAGVGHAITNAVVICYSFILVLNFILTIALNVLRITLLERYQI